MIMAGGEGSRLYPLTTERSKPSVPFGGRYRIVDFVLSNFVNSNINAIYLLVQYKSQSLIEHIRKAWTSNSITSHNFVTVVPPQMRVGSEWFQGTADAVYQNLNLIYKHRPEVVAVFGADHIYRMDICQMLDFHRQNDADVTVAALPVPIADACAFGVIGVNAENRIVQFEEKPKNPTPMPSDSSRCYASMGNYLFKTDVLTSALMKAHHHKQNDFGKDVLPQLAKSHRVLAYDFATNKIPGLKPYEDQSYWRDLGTIEAYFAAHQDVMGAQPQFDAYNPSWPIYSSEYHGPVAKILGGSIENSIFGGGTIIHQAKIKNCVVRREVIIEDGVELDQCIVMDYCVIKKGSRLRNVIVDRYNVLPENTHIGFDAEADRKRFHVSDTGITVVSQGWRSLDLTY